MYRQKQKYYRVPKNREAIRKAETVQAISRWWNDRTKDRIMFKGLDPETLVQGIHYKGRVTWPDQVAFRTLYEEFMTSEGAGLEVSPGTFCVFFHRITKIPKGTEGSKEKIKDEGKYLWTTSRTLLNLPQ